jgi:DNA-binding response OmpR family regulator
MTPAPRHILIVEDDPSIAAGLALNLRIEGYESVSATDVEAALEILREVAVDLILLDISLPGRNGLELLSELRDDNDHTPVIVLSARQEEFDKVAALRLGADDYVTKPFALAELMARVGAVLRRSALDATVASVEVTAASAAPATDLSFGPITVDVDTRTVTREGAPVSLTHLEFELLTYFLRNPSKVLSRDKLLKQVWGLNHSGSKRTVDNFVAQLRSKLESDADAPRHFVTVRGSGYRFDP